MKKRLFGAFAVCALALSGVVACGEQSGTGRTEWTWENSVEVDNELGYVILVGEDGNPEAEDRTEGCIDAMNEIAAAGGFTVKELARKTCIDTNGNSWNDQTAKETVETWVTQYGDDLDFIISNNDGMAIAASGATGLVPGTPIIGFDALTEACNMIKAGTLAGSVSQNGDDQALTTALVLANLIKGEDDVVAGYNGKANLVTSEISDHVISTELSAVTAGNADEKKPGAYVTVNEDSAVAGKKMLVAYYSANDNYISETFMKALPHYAESLGFDVTPVAGDGTNDTDLLDRVRAAVTETDFDCVALNIITHANYESYLEAVGDVPVVFFNRQPKTSDNTDVADLSGLEKVYYVGSSSTGQGAAQGQIIKDWYNALQ